MSYIPAYVFNLTAYVPDFKQYYDVISPYLIIPNLPPYIIDYFSTAYVYLCDFYNGSVVYLSHTWASLGSAWASSSEWASVSYDRAADIIADAFLSIHRFVYSK